MKKVLVSVGVGTLATSGAVSAAEIEQFTYDVHGRLVKIERDAPAGNPNDDIDTTIVYDKANNRTSTSNDDTS